MSETTLTEALEFAENPEPRCACVLLLDTSGSMKNEPISELNDGLLHLQEAVAKDPVALRRLEFAIVTFNSSVIVIQDFATVDQFEMPVLAASGLTWMGTAINQALDMVESRKATYKKHGTYYYRPWVLLITDGEPQGEDPSAIDKATLRLHDAESTKKVAFYAVGVQSANMSKLKQVVVREPLKLRELDFKELFEWLSASLQSVSRADPDQVHNVV